jgi:ribosomal RNA assembly protein
MKVLTTKETYDPYIIIKGRDILKLISRGVSIEKGKRVFEDNIFSNVVKIRNYVKGQKVFEKRRQVKILF